MELVLVKIIYNLITGSLAPQKQNSTIMTVNQCCEPMHGQAVSCGLGEIPSSWEIELHIGTVLIMIINKLILNEFTREVNVQFSRGRNISGEGWSV